LGEIAPTLLQALRLLRRLEPEAQLVRSLPRALEADIPASIACCPMQTHHDLPLLVTFV
jgi:hypothetical protein